MNTYSFVNAKERTAADVEQLLAAHESYFKTQQDSEQLQIAVENCHWMVDHIPDCSLTIKCGEEVVGTTLVMPCTVEMMQEFLADNIDEAQLVDNIMRENIHGEQITAIYLCSGFVLPSHRGKNLAVEGMVQSIRKILSPNQRVVLFYWRYSGEGEAFTRKIASTLGFELLEKPHEAD